MGAAKSSTLTPDEYRAVAARQMPEKQLQELVRRCAKVNGWLMYHPWMSVKSAPGFPDCTLLRNRRLVFAELKTEAGKLTDAQQRWLDELAEAGIETRVWRPRHWLSGEIEAFLTQEV